MLDLLRLFTILSVAIYLVPGGAHLFELPSKMSLSHAEYMVVQRIYAGWSLFGVAIIAAFLLTALHTGMVRSNRTAFWFSLAALICLAVTQVIFWTFTYPMNVASNNWTVTPQDFEEARRRWEYSHAVNAVLTLAALAAIIVSVLTDARRSALH